MTRTLSDIAILFGVGLLLGSIARYVYLQQTAWPHAPTPAAAIYRPPPRPVGDGDPVRDALRQQLLHFARAADARPCDLDARAGFQIALHDYARASGEAPEAFHTPLDAEIVGVVGAARRLGLIDPDLVARWRPVPRDAVERLLASAHIDLVAPIPDACAQIGTGAPIATPVSATLAP